MTLMVKICGLRKVDDVSAATAAGANAVGFVFADSVRRITARDATKICAALPSHVKRVAVMLHPSNDEWQDVLRKFAPDVLQTDAGDFESLDVPAAVQCWPVYREDGDIPDSVRNGDSELAAPYVYEGAGSGTGEAVDWSRAATLAAAGNMILAGGLDAGNVAAAIRAVRPLGVDVSSGVESARGQKDAGRISDFVRAARAAEKQL